MKINYRKISGLQKSLLRWHGNNGRHHLAWRQPARSEYEIVIAEILLQRTSAKKVSEVYDSFLQSYPDWSSIVFGGVKRLEQTLQPLGLFRQRAARIMKLAELLCEHGCLPGDPNDLESLPMFGQYLTNAIQLQIYGLKKPLLDVNMARVLERLFGPRQFADIRYDPLLQNLACKMVECEEPVKINWAILDFAHSVCKAIKPSCQQCEFSTWCHFHGELKNLD